jgi:hypothetical protein
MSRGNRVNGWTTWRLRDLFAGAWLLLFTTGASAERPFDFKRDTFAFANETVFEYHDGYASARRDAPQAVKAKRFVQHCFVMSRSVEQFRKFARFDPSQPPLGDAELAARIHQVTRWAAWDGSAAENERVVIPGYSDLRSLSRARGEIVRNNIGLGWPTYFRVGNWRIFLPHGPAQQAKTQVKLERALHEPEGYFVAYLTTTPENFEINHAVLVYAEKPRAPRSDTTRYLVYDPNHADRPRILAWSPRDRSFLYERDTDFVGGHVTVWQVYGRPLQ